MYDVSGKKLLETFNNIQTSPNADIFIGVEGLTTNTLNTISQTKPLNSNQFVYQLDQNTFLRNWLLRFADIIPQYLGGRANACNCNNPESRLDRDHSKGCYFSWWNRNCSRWFRKIALLHYLSQKKAKEYSHLIWVDADCIFKRVVDLRFIENECFRGNDIFYMLGQKRRVIETGIFGIKFNPAGLNFIRILCDRYISGKFKGYCRWDDGYVFDKVRKEMQLKGILKGTDIGYYSHSIEVADECTLSPYIVHFKGRHGRIMNIMK